MGKVRGLRAWMQGWRHRRFEVWLRQDVAGHALACRAQPVTPHEDGAVSCDCYASWWRRVL